MDSITIAIAAEPAESDDVRWCFEQYYAELDRRFEAGFDVTTALPLGLEELTPPLGLVLVARRESRLLGCGAVKLSQPGVAEIKRVWVADDARGQGLGGRLLAELEAQAVEAGKQVVRLDTNRSLTEAMALYRRRGYREVPAFNEEMFADHWFEKPLTPGSAGVAAKTSRCGSLEG